MRKLRLAWFVALGVLFAAGLSAGLLVMVARTGRVLSIQAGNPLNTATLVLLVAASFALMWYRMRCYKRYWTGLTVEPAGYARGNLTLFAGIAAVGVLGAVACGLTAEPIPGLMVTFLALLLTAINWPHGGPMDPAPPRLAQ